MNIGKVIKLCRIYRDMNQSELSEQADISISHLSLIERGERQASFEVLVKLSKAFGIPLSLIVFTAEDKTILENIDSDLVACATLAAYRLMSEPNKQESNSNEYK